MTSQDEDFVEQIRFTETKKAKIIEKAHDKAEIDYQEFLQELQQNNKDALEKDKNNAREQIQKKQITEKDRLKKAFVAIESEASKYIASQQSNQKVAASQVMIYLLKNLLT